MDMRNIDTTELLHFSGVLIAAIVVYVFFWKKSRPFAVVALLCLIGYLSYHTLDWKYLQSYFFVDWGSGGITN